MVFSVSDLCIQHDQLLWCFQYQAYVYSMISYNGVSVSDLCIQNDQLLWCFQLLSPAMANRWGNIEMLGVHLCVRACVRPSQSLLAR